MLMQRVTIDYRRLDAETLWRNFQPSWSARLLALVIVWAVLQLFLWPYLLWFVLEQRWLSLAVFELLILLWGRTLSRNATRLGLEQLQRIPPMQLTIRPEGLEVVSEHTSHLLQGWRKFRAVRRTPLGVSLAYTDHSLSLGYIIPNACFDNAADAESFAAAAEQAIAAKATAPAVTGTKLLSVPRSQQYLVSYQLTRAELYSEDAKNELIRLYPDTLVNTTAVFVKQSRNWKYFAGGGLLIALIWFEDRIIPVQHALEGLLFVIGGIFYMKVFGSLYPRLLAAIRKVRKSPAPPVEVWLGDEGIFRAAPDERLQIPWSGVDALLVHEHRLTLWKRDWCRLIIPLRVFDSPEQAHECERWIQTTLQKQFNRLAVAELAEPEPAIALVDPRPVSNNPYQAPGG
jgi:hypothetical protein